MAGLHSEHSGDLLVIKEQDARGHMLSAKEEAFKHAPSNRRGRIPSPTSCKTIKESQAFRVAHNKVEHIPQIGVSSRSGLE